jgi:hypothetical protein
MMATFIKSARVAPTGKKSGQGGFHSCESITYLLLRPPQFDQHRNGPAHDRVGLWQRNLGEVGTVSEAVNGQAAGRCEGLNVVPFPVIVPIVVVPVKAAVDAGCGQGPRGMTGLILRRQQETQKGRRIAGWIGHGAKFKTAKPGKSVLERGFMSALYLENTVQSRKLRHPNRCMKLTEPEIEADVRMLVCASIDPQMVMAVVGECLRHAIHVAVVGHNGATLTTRNGFDIVER